MPTAAPATMGKAAAGTADAVEKNGGSPVPRSVAGIAARPSVAVAMSALEIEDETVIEIGIVAVGSATGAGSRKTTAGPEIVPSTRSVAASARASAGTRAGVPTRGVGPGERSKRGEALGRSR